MNKYTLDFNNNSLEHLYQKREIPTIKSWTQKMAATVAVIGVATIGFNIYYSVESPKPYISQLILVGAALLAIILLQIKKNYFTTIHTINCTIYMATTIWTYVDTDFYHDPNSNFLNGYIQGLATYVYITGLRLLPKMYLITLLFVNMAFCSGKEKFLAQFLQITPLWLIFLYKTYVDERTNRNLFLSQQQEHVYKYIIQNVMPNGLYLVKFDKKMERVELHSSNQKPKLLSYVKNTDDMKHLMKNTILAEDDMKLQNLMKSNNIQWSDTLDGHLRRKINQALEWGEKRFIKLKDRNVIRSKQGTSSNDSDMQQSIFNISNGQIDNARSPTKHTIIYSEHEIQNNQTPNVLQQKSRYHTTQNQQNSNNFNNFVTIQPSAHNLQVLSPTGDIRNARSKYRTLNTQNSQQQFISQNIDQPKENANSNNKNPIALASPKLRSQKNFVANSQQIISVNEVASNLLGNSQFMNGFQFQQNTTQRNNGQRDQSVSGNQKSALTQRNVAAATNQNVLDKKVSMNQDNQNPYTDLVEYFSAVYKKNDDTQFKLNLRLSTFYLNEIYGVISIEDESFKEKFLNKEKVFFLLQELYTATLRDTNNFVVNHLYGLMKNQSSPSQKNTENNGMKYESMYAMLRLKNKLDNYNNALQIISGRYPQKVLASECSEFNLIADLKPFFDVCQQKAKLNQVKLFIDYSPEITENDMLFTCKPLLNHLIFNITFNTLENTPAKGVIAIRVDSSDNNKQIKFKVFNTTNRAINVDQFYSLFDPITLYTLNNDIKYSERPQIGIRMSHRILQKIGPSSRIEYGTNGNNNDVDCSDSFHLNSLCNNNDSYNGASANQFNQYYSTSNTNMLYQTFYVYRDMQNIAQNNMPPNSIKNSNLNNEVAKSQFGGLSMLQKNTPYHLDVKNNQRNDNKKGSYLNSIYLDKSLAIQANQVQSPQNEFKDTQKLTEDQKGTIIIETSNNVNNNNMERSSGLINDESTHSFKQWMRNKQYEQYNKQIPKLFSSQQKNINNTPSLQSENQSNLSSLATDKPMQ